MRRNIKQEILEVFARKKRHIKTCEIMRFLKISRPTAKKYIQQLNKEGWLEDDDGWYRINIKKVFEKEK